MLSGFNHTFLKLNFDATNFAKKIEFDTYQSEIIKSLNKILYLKCYIKFGDHSFIVDTVANKTTSFFKEGTAAVYTADFYVPLVRETETETSIEGFGNMKAHIFEDVDGKWKYMLTIPDI